MRFLNTLFSYGFRPLFLLAALHALLSISFWSAAWLGFINVEWQRIPMYWHGHEMIMGLAAAAIGGFLLTAVANWTGRPPVAGIPLALLCAVWLIGRLSMPWPLLSAIADVSYWSGLWLLVANEIIRTGNRRNYKVLLVLALILVSDAVYHAAELNFPAIQQQTLWAQIWLVILLINIIGGRVIPAFTGNWLRRQSAATPLSEQELPAAFSRLDLVAIIALVIFAVAAVLKLPAPLSVMLGSFALFMQTWRLARWKFYKTLSEPLVWMMHLAYLWIPVGIALWTLSLAGLLPVTAAIHALTIGAISGMIISIGSRAALGHTGRALRSHPLLTSCIILLSCSALVRIAGTLWASNLLIGISSAAWLAAFACFAVLYVPILLKPSSA